MADQATTAVVADRMPLVRLGLAASLRLADVTTVAHADDLADGVEAARQAGASLLVLGSGGESVVAGLHRHLRRLAGTRVVVLVGQADRAALVAMLEAGADAVALRTIAPEDLGVLVRKVLAGERAVGAALVSVLVGLGGDRPAPPDEGAAAVGVPLFTFDDDDGSTVDLRAADERGVALTTKESQVLAHLARGESNAEIADALYVSPATVKTHLAHIYAKLGVGTRHEAMSRAVALGLLS